MDNRLTITIDLDSGAVSSNYFEKSVKVREEKLKEMALKVFKTGNGNQKALNGFSAMAEIMINFVCTVSLMNTDVYHYLVKYTETIRELKANDVLLNTENNE